MLVTISLAKIDARFHPSVLAYTCSIYLYIYANLGARAPYYALSRTLAHSRVLSPNE